MRIIERNTMNDNIKFIKCPACGTEMKKVYLEEQDFIVDICLDGCGGIWLDNQELKKIDEQHENIDALKIAQEGKEFASVDEDSERMCPICNVKMHKNHVSTKKEIVIDECYQCGGKFFDNNELEQMRSQYENDDARLDDIKKSMESDAAQRELIEKYGYKGSDYNFGTNTIMKLIDKYYAAKSIFRI